MTSFLPIVVTASLLLLPLIPAAVLYLILTPRAGRRSGEAEGHLHLPTPFGALKLRFNVLGSVATYTILLAVEVWIHSNVQKQAAMGNLQAWRVEVPIKLDTEGDPAPAIDEADLLRQARVDLLPSSVQSDPSMIRFWVVPDGERLPTANISLPKLSRKPATINLNDFRFANRDYDARRILWVNTVSLDIGQQYPSATP